MKENDGYYLARRARDRLTQNISLQTAKKLIMTGINAIDDPFRGLLPTDFLLIAAGTGVGKTALASTIAKNVAISGHKVVYFALEAYDGEIEDRIKFPLLKIKDFKAWYAGRYYQYYRLEDKVISELPSALCDNLFLMYKRPDAPYTIEKLVSHIDDICEMVNVDLVIIDHLHYFDHTSRDDYKEQREIVQALRAITLIKKVPIILYAQVRKADKRHKQLVPTSEDIMGTSDIIKNVTGVLTIANARDEEITKAGMYPTYFYFSKNRFDGSVKKYLMLTFFDAAKQEYLSKYKLYYIDADATEKSEIKMHMLPDWVKNITTSMEFAI